MYAIAPVSDLHSNQDEPTYAPQSRYPEDSSQAHWGCRRYNWQRLPQFSCHLGAGEPKVPTGNILPGILESRQ